MVQNNEEFVQRRYNIFSLSEDLNSTDPQLQSDDTTTNADNTASHSSLKLQIPNQNTQISHPNKSQ